MILFFVDRECLEGFSPLSDYTIPPAFRAGEELLADTWGRLLGGEVGLATRGFLAESVEWLTGGALRHAEPRGDALLLNACASPFSGELVSLLEHAAGMGSLAVYAGRRVVAAKLSSGSRGLFEAFTGVVEPELVYGHMWMFEEEAVDPRSAFLDPRSLLAGILGALRGGVAEGAVIEEGAVVRRSYVGPGARVSAGAVVEDSVLEGSLLVEGRVRGSYLSRNTWVAGYVEGVILGLGAQVYPGAYLEGCLAGVYARALPGAYARGARLGHGEAITGGAPAGDALEEYRETLYRRWGRLPSRFEEELLRRRQLSRRGRRP